MQYLQEVMYSSFPSLWISKKKYIHLSPLVSRVISTLQRGLS